MENTYAELELIQVQLRQDEADYETSLDLFFTPLFDDIEDSLAKYSYEDVEVMNSIECLEYILGL